jgi:protein phosphatase
MQVKITVATNVGRVRTNNEDNFTITNPWSAQNPDLPLDSRGILLMVADGMGGSNAGEVASNIATSVVKEQFEMSPLPQEDETRKDFLKKLLLIAHKSIVNQAFQHQGNAGMGTTVVLAWLIDNKAYIVWCGDSRCYLFRPEMPFQQQLQLLTDDHSLVWQKVITQELTPEQARLHPDSNIILQSLGDPSQMPKPDARMLNLQTNDQIMLCSDGLHGMLSDEQIAYIFREPADNICREFVKQANKAGGEDNITVITASIQQLQANVVSTPINNSSLPTTDLSNEAQFAQKVDKIPSHTTTKNRRWGLLALPILAAIMLLGGIGYNLYVNNKTEPKDPIVKTEPLNNATSSNQTHTVTVTDVNNNHSSSTMLGNIDTSKNTSIYKNKKDEKKQGGATSGTRNKSKNEHPKASLDPKTAEALKEKVQDIMKLRYDKVGTLVETKKKQCPELSGKLDQINKVSIDKLVSFFKDKGVVFEGTTVTKVNKNIPSSVFTDAEQKITDSVNEINAVSCSPAKPPTTAPTKPLTPTKPPPTTAPAKPPATTNDTLKSLKSNTPK